MYHEGTMARSPLHGPRKMGGRPLLEFSAMCLLGNEDALQRWGVRLLYPVTI